MSAAPQFVSIPIESLVCEAKVEFDLYLQLSTKHVLYLRKGNVFDSSRREKMREKNVKSMWIQPADEAQWRVMFERRLDAAYDPKSALAPLERSALVHGAQAAAAEALFRSPTDVGRYIQAADGAKRFTDFLVKDDSALKSLLAVPNVERTVASHGVAVAAVAVAMAKKLGLGESKDLHLLALGCLLHDAGHYGQPDSGFGLPSKSLTPEQQKFHQEHAALGVRATQELVHFDQHVIKIILHHEEHVDGTGFPKGLNEKQMHPYTMIAATANAFDHVVSFEGESFQGAMKRLIVEKIGRHPLAHFNALKSIVQGLG